MYKLLVAFILLLITIPSYADNLTGGNIGSHFPPLGVREEASSDTVRPRTIIVDTGSFFPTDNDGEYFYRPASSDTVKNGIGWERVDSIVILANIDDSVGIGTSSPLAELDVSGRIIEDGTYADIYVSDGSVAQSIPTGATYTKLTAFTNNGPSVNCTADVANDKITITKAGFYIVNCSINGRSGTANVTFIFAAFLNSVEQDQVHCHRKFGSAGDNGSSSMSGIIDVTTVPWDLDVRARHDSGGSVDFTSTYMNLCVSYLGET